MGGTPPLSARDILDYQSLWGIEFEAWEIDAIHSMDSAYRDEVKQKETNSGNNNK